MEKVIATITDVFTSNGSAQITTSYKRSLGYPFTVAFISDSAGRVSGTNFNEQNLIIVDLIRNGLLGLNSDGTLYSRDPGLSVNENGEILYTY